jgi:hypothetical protein
MGSVEIGFCEIKLGLSLFTGIFSRINYLQKLIRINLPLLKLIKTTWIKASAEEMPDCSEYTKKVFLYFSLLLVPFALEQFKLSKRLGQKEMRITYMSLYASEGNIVTPINILINNYQLIHSSEKLKPTIFFGE